MKGISELFKCLELQCLSAWFPYLLRSLLCYSVAINQFLLLPFLFINVFTSYRHGLYHIVHCGTVKDCIYFCWKSSEQLT